MKSNKLTRTEDFISSSCTTKSYFVQNQATLFALINLASQITSTITENDCTCKHRPNRLGLCHDAIRFVRREAVAKRLHTNFRFVTPSGKPNDLRSTCLQAGCMCKKTSLRAFRKSLFYALWANKSSYVDRRSSSLCKAKLIAMPMPPWGGKGLTNLRFVCKRTCTCKKVMAMQSFALHTSATTNLLAFALPEGHGNQLRFALVRSFARRFVAQRVCTSRGKEGQVNERVTFNKLVPQELFLIQNIQNQRKSHYTIVRPLINCSRHIITMACIINRLPVYPDITNKKVRYSRNRIRKQVLPSLQFFFNPEIEKALFKFSEFHKTA